jgi:CheY-like chemotaxis protein
MHRLAVVEDNEDNRLLLQAILSDWYDLTEYVNGPDALAGITTHRPAAVLLDISLPGMDGREVLRQLRANPLTANLKVIALTAHAMSGDRAKFLAEGFDEYVSKPIVDEEILLNILQRWLSEDRARAKRL